MRYLVKAATLTLASTMISSCGSTPKAIDVNVACAFVEGYNLKTTLALADAADGGSAVESIQYTVTPAKEQLAISSPGRKIFEEFEGAMYGWAAGVDSAALTGSSNGITDARIELEKNIEGIAKSCQDLGWRFEKGWRS